jgi:hypothetical protein
VISRIGENGDENVLTQADQKQTRADYFWVLTQFAGTRNVLEGTRVHRVTGDSSLGLGPPPRLRARNCVDGPRGFRAGFNIEVDWTGVHVICIATA